jgi:hypothetical protein
VFVNGMESYIQGVESGGGDADPRAVEDSRHLKLTMRKSSGS